MAKINIQYPVIAKYAVTAGAPVYSDGVVLAAAISANITASTASEKLYADGKVKEEVSDFTGGKISVNTDDLSDEKSALLLGHTFSTETGLVAKSTDVAPYVGFGFVGEVVRDGVRAHRAVWLTKVLFSEPADEFSTKTEKVSFGTAKLEGSLAPDCTDTWKREKTFTTLDAAKTWLNTQAGILVTP